MSLWQALRTRVEQAAEGYDHAVQGLAVELDRLDKAHRFAVQEFGTSNHPNMRRSLELIAQAKDDARRALQQYQQAAKTARDYLTSVDPDGAGGSVRGLPAPEPVGPIKGGWQLHGGPHVEPARQAVNDVSRQRMAVYTELGPEGLTELIEQDDGIVGLRTALLASSGHATRRHGPDVTTARLEKRAVYKFDPITGTTTDWESGGDHPASRHATAFTSREALIFAEASAWNSPEGRNARANSDSLPDDHEDKNRTAVRISASQALGPDFRQHVHGRSRIGSATNPTGCQPTQFSDQSTIVTVYERESPQHEWLPYTCYIKP